MDDQRARRLGAAVFVAIGSASAGIAVYDVLARDDPAILTLLENAVPLAMALAVTAVGGWLVRSDFPATEVRRFVAWTLVGMGGVVVTAMWVVGFQLLQGPVEPAFVVGYAAIWGSVAGLLVGGYDVRNRRRGRELARADEVHTAVREIEGRLLRAEDRAEVERGVCEGLAGVSGFRSAWIGEQEGDAVAVRTAAGVDPSVPEWSSLQRRALSEGEPAVEERSPGTAIAVPVAYDRFPYGVLTVRADAGVVGERERTAIAEAATRTGDAINALRARAALLADSLVELRFELSSEDSFVAGISARTGGRLDLLTVTASDGRRTSFFEVDGVDPGAATRIADEYDHVIEVRSVGRNGSPSVLEVVYEASVLAPILERHGGSLRDIRSDDGRAELTVTVPRSADVRAIAEQFDERFDAGDLLARREWSGSTRTATDFREAVKQELTTRQWTVATTAYHGGYFESPRARTGEELAERLEISGPTFHDHLRTVERSLFEAVFDDETPPG